MPAKNTNEGANTKFYSLKAKADEVNIPHFVLSEKIAGSWVQSQHFDTMVGMLEKAEIKEKEYKGAKQNVFVIVLSDTNERSQIEMTHNGTAYSIINALSSLTTALPELTIKVYRNEGKDVSGKGNGKFYGNASILADGEKLSWGFAPSEAPKKVAVMVAGKPFLKDGIQVYDDTELRAFYEQVFIDKIMPLVSKSVAKETGTHSVNPKLDGLKENPMNTEAFPGLDDKDTDSDDLPFVWLLPFLLPLAALIA